MARPKTEAQRVAALVKQGMSRRDAVQQVRDMMRHEADVQDETGRPIRDGADLFDPQT